MCSYSSQCSLSVFEMVMSAPSSEFLSTYLNLFKKVTVTFYLDLWLNMHMLFLWPLSRWKLLLLRWIPIVSGMVPAIAHMFSKPLSLSISDNMLSGLSSYLFVLTSGSYGKKVQSPVFSFLASTFHTEPVGLHAISHFSNIPHANASQINRYVFQTLEWFVQLPGIYLYLCIPETLWCHLVNWTHYLPLLRTSNSSYMVHLSKCYGKTIQAPRLFCYFLLFSLCLLTSTWS